MTRYRIKDGVFDGHPADHYVKFCMLPQPLWKFGERCGREICGKTKAFSHVLFCIQLLGEHVAWADDQDKIERVSAWS